MRSLLFLIVFAFVLTGKGTAQGTCTTQEYREQLIRNHPSFAASIQKASLLNTPAFQQELISGTAENVTNTPALIRIPVVVHVVYNRDEQNISEDQVRSQIETLNKEFRKAHADTTLIPAHFRELAADCYIEFALAKVDPKGYATSGIIRKFSSIKTFGMDDRIKSNATGGSDAWDNERYLNIWVGNLVGGIIGYSSPLGGPPEKDGIVVAYFAFGTRGNIRSPYNKGRTTLHEVGHWLGLKHIWGEANCGSDEVEDTPPQSGPTRGCPGGVVRSCGNNTKGNMYNNYMDLTNDECINMFTIGQRDRMRASFLPGNPRNALLRSTALTATPIAGTVTAEDSAMRKGMQVYPNPAYDWVRIVYEGSVLPEGNTITIHNSFGQLVVFKRSFTRETQLELHAMKEGLYYIRINGQSAPFKLIKAARQ